MRVGESVRGDFVGPIDTTMTWVGIDRSVSTILFETVGCKFIPIL